MSNHFESTTDDFLALLASRNRSKSFTLGTIDLPLDEAEAEADFIAMGMSTAQVERLMAMDGPGVLAAGGGGGSKSPPKKKSPDAGRKKRRIV
ncbi:unnamed protein product [Zymoseptoria tritici ST99CH_1A5]|uniref:Uncharacterized protein n=1 Tax=Zymoseptoria tritici ST99CH_1A5 TaxID=1276529 RepID=A0A1Y6L479_ZYMTR|nr:unnamed protein product [Zymoseptoria tritici ST99CH_3D1]SMY19125.1 unnamed protein product [Zymoseptoria tritici ST99CH_1A5]